ncbi:MAG TPA: RimK family alpha-L-glutamate ligase [Virgibacillus sp.]|nr:RimK family alpha-L-glutamate ligase [Virgibacillus sp.]
MNRSGWIIYNGYLPSPAFLDFAEWLQQAATAQAVTTTIYKNSELLAFLTGDQFDVLADDKEVLPDFVIFTDKDIYLARQLELRGIRVFNSARAIEASDDKITTYQMLAQHKLPIPKTIIAPKQFGYQEDLDVNFAKKIHTYLSFPLIIKEAYGSFGEQVYLIKTEQQLQEKVRELSGIPYLFQEFIQSSYGKDIRLHVVGDNVVASMLRQSQTDFRANVSAGGSMEAYQPTTVEKELAIAATKAIGADFAGVDLLFGPEQNPIICEVNSNAHIRNMYDCTGINVADEMIQYIMESFKKE